MRPNRSLLDQCETQKPQNGLMVRWNDCQYPEAFFQFNPGLFQHYGKPYHPADFGEEGFINPTNGDANCPQAYYYKNNIRSSDGKTAQINGATSLCNLTDKAITSHYGYFADEWISLKLPNYV